MVRRGGSRRAGEKKSQGIRGSTALLAALLMAVFGLVSIPTVATADPPGNCTSHTGWTEIGVDDLTYTYNAPTGKLIEWVCAKGPAGADLFIDGPFDPGLTSYTFNAANFGDSWENDNGQVQNISHVGVKLIDVPTDACPTLSGNQPPGTECTHGPDRETQNVEGNPDCTAGTVTISHQSRTRTYSWDGDSWEPNAWSAWVTDSTSTRPVTAQECPTFDQCPGTALPGDQPAGTPCSMGPDTERRTVTTTDCQADTVTSQPQSRTRTYSWNGTSWVAGEWSAWTNDGAPTVVSADDTVCPPPPPDDECPLIEGNQPEGTDCDDPGPVTQQRTSDSTDCKAGTVTTLTEQRTAAYTMVDNVWVLGEFGDWTFVSETTRDATLEECPEPEVEGEQETDDKDPKPAPEVAGEQASAPPKVVPAAQVPTQVAAGLGESTLGGSEDSALVGQLALLMVLLGGLLTGTAFARRRRQLPTR